MAFGGREIKAFLTLDVSGFNKGLTSAQSKTKALQQNTQGLSQSVDGVGTSASKTSKEVDKAAKSTQTAGKNASTAKSKFTALNSAMNLLKLTAGFLAITLGMELATRMMQVANSAVNAESSIRGMAKGMGWSTSQVTAYLDEMSRLQTIYRKTDMNAVGTEVAKMARIYKLNADEAKDFIETSAVFSSAMAMEGRSARDSALALKDLIDQGQGWERRLSEIGVTGEALKATGLWSGDKSDKKGIIAALNQVLEKRSLSQMAKEINNLDDALQVLTIAGGQLLGAFLIPAAPLIYGLTMALADIAYGVKNIVEWLVDVWNGLPGWVQLGIIVGASVIAFTALGAILTGVVIPAASTAIINFINMLLPLFGLEVTAISASGGFSLLAGAIWSALAPLVPFIAAGAALAIVVYKVGEYFGWWKDIPTMIEAIKAGVMRLWNAFVNNPHVVAIITGIKEAWNDLVNFLAPLWKNLFPASTGSFDIVRGIIDLFGWLGDTVARVWDFFQNNPLGQVLGLLAYFVNPLLFIILNFNKIVWIVTMAANAVKAFFGAFYDESGNFVGIIQGFQNAFGMLWNWLASIDWAGVINGFFTGIYNAFQGLGQYIWNTLFGSLGSGELDLGGMLAGALQQIIGFFADNNIATLLVRLLFGDAAATQFSSQIKAFFGPMTSWIGNGLNQLVSAAVWLWNVLSPIGSALSWIGGLILDGAWQSLIGWWNALVGVGQFLYQIFTTLTGAWDALVGSFFNEKGDFVGLIDGFKNVGAALWDWIVNIDWAGMGVAFWNGLMGIFSGGLDVVGTIVSYLMGVDWIGLFTSIGEFLLQYNPISLLIGLIFNSGGAAGGFFDAIVSWASGIDWYGILMGMFQFIAQYNPLTMIITLLFGDATGQTFGLMLMNIFITAGQMLMTGITIIMNVITTLANWITNAWNTIKSTTLWVWNAVWATINDVMIRIWGVVSPYVNKILGAWNYLKNGLVAAASVIRDRVWGPIKTLWDRLAGFWSFLMNPGGGRSSAYFKTSRSIGMGAATAGGAGFPGAGGAGGVSTPRYKKDSLPVGAGFFGGIGGRVADTTNAIIARAFSMTHGGSGPGTHPDDGVDKDIMKLFECTDPEKCSAGWDMPWSDSILNMVKGWKMNIFGMSIGLNELQSGSLALFERLASAIMSGIRYSFYFGDGKSNAEVLASRSCNCYDGAQLMCALANAMGLPCSMVNGFWGSIPHTWATVGGKAFDTTAFQKRGSWRGPAQGAGFGPVNRTRKVVEFVFNITGPIYDKDGLIKEIKQVVRNELNDSVDVII